MSRGALLALVLAVAAGCGQKGPLIAPEPEPVEQPQADDTDETDDAEAEAKRRRGS